MRAKYQVPVIAYRLTEFDDRSIEESVRREAFEQAGIAESARFICLETV